MSYTLQTWDQFLEEQIALAQEREALQARRTAKVVTEFIVRRYDDGTTRWFLDGREVDQPE